MSHQTHHSDPSSSPEHPRPGLGTGPGIGPVPYGVASDPAPPKRKRKKYSCIDCRRRKLKCDRVFPVCGRCMRAGPTGACRYDERAGPGSEVGDGQLEGGRKADSVVPGAAGMSRAQDVGWGAAASAAVSPAVGLEERLTGLARRVARIESPAGVGQEGSMAEVLLARGAVPGKSPGSGESPALQTLKEEETMLFRGKSFKTQFFGASSSMTIASSASNILQHASLSHLPFYFQNPDFQVFMQDPSTFSPTLQQVRNEAYDLRVKYRKVKKEIAANQPKRNLRELIPPREEVDPSVTLYWETIGTTYRILHAPQFWASYHTFWDHPSEATESFMAVLLLILSTTRCLLPNRTLSFYGLSSAAREFASLRITACEDWWMGQSKKHLTLEMFQVRILLYISKLANSIKAKRLWEEATSMLNFSLARGLHRDPTLIGRDPIGQARSRTGSRPRITPFENEMRRRLWATIVELELQASFDRGLPSFSVVHTADCGSPLNISDDEFGEETLEMPPPRPLEEFTQTSFLHLASRSFTLRLVMNRMTNDRLSTITYEELLAYDQELNNALEALPAWTRVARNMTEEGPLSPATVPALLLDIQLSQHLLMIHLPFARNTERHSRYLYSRVVCVNSATRILDFHARLAKQQSYALNTLREDVFRSAVTIAHSVVMWKATEQPAELVLQALIPAFSARIESAVTILQDKILRIGELYGQMWLLMAGYSMFRAAISPAPRDLNPHLMLAIERLLHLFYRVLGSQETWPQAPDAGAPTLSAGNSVNETTPNAGTPAGATVPFTAAPTPFMQLPELTLDDMQFGVVDNQGWNFEDVWPWNATGLAW
ncbi:hypothetical protein EJ06DRAFT_526025 [Trichodelitschia bisporula]|uniref:Zn(2)-C6 fungal-type domain-containing protein n=1 Tax=Trichodelitschia bisporula TaxID=703511 RepID=A0A6G1IBL4_9PEZI|nr:hypothetical protein EJ06DRAFT_526025 [Trichodelitschia bisporula]